MADWTERTELLLGADGLARLNAACVAVVGLGGVGATAAEMLARAGVGSLVLIDSDTVGESNLNRQLIALRSTLGQSKSSVLAARLRDINPDIRLCLISEYINEDNIPSVFSSIASCPMQELGSENVSLSLDPTVRFAPVPPLTVPRVARFSEPTPASGNNDSYAGDGEFISGRLAALGSRGRGPALLGGPGLEEKTLREGGIDYVVDAIDTLSPKIALIQYCLKNDIRLVSSMGSGAKVDATKIRVADISGTKQCPLAHMLRKRLHKLGITTGFQAVYSEEAPRRDSVILEESRNKKSQVGTISYLPTVFGCVCAQTVICEIAEVDKNR